jgi:carbamoyltransferase
VIILGLNAYHGDAAACILRDGVLVAAAEEERFRRIKHCAGFPAHAVRYCLREAGATLADVDHIALNRNPRANVLRKGAFTLARRPKASLITDRLRNARNVGGATVKSTLAEALGVAVEAVHGRVHHVEHHVAHLASSYYVSPHREAALASVDGFGDFVSTMWGVAADGHLRIDGRVFFPHSLGLFYLAMTQYLGFMNYGDEYKVMGLAAYGEPSQMNAMQKIVRLAPDGTFRLALECFSHHTQGVSMTWQEGAPTMGAVYTPVLEQLLGPARRYEDPIEKRHQDIAASVQWMYEEACFNLLNGLHQRTGLTNLCVAGGCALNSVANGKIFSRTPFTAVYIQPAAGDAGGALGAAYYTWHVLLGEEARWEMEHAYWGPGFADQAFAQALAQRSTEMAEVGCAEVQFASEEELCRRTAEHVAAGEVVGWFQGRMEWGPRALGNRSIIVDPRRADARGRLNARVKRREPFRPFAPSVLLERVGEYFETDSPEPFMLKVSGVRPEKRSVIPAVTHVDGSGRLQTVRQQDNPRYWLLIKDFERITGVPVVLNTSFNENEPIVCTPAEALDCFLRTDMDVLVLGTRMLAKRGAGNGAAHGGRQ